MGQTGRYIFKSKFRTKNKFTSDGKGWRSEDRRYKGNCNEPARRPSCLPLAGSQDEPALRTQLRSARSRRDCCVGAQRREGAEAFDCLRNYRNHLVYLLGCGGAAEAETQAAAGFVGRKADGH